MTGIIHLKLHFLFVKAPQSNYYFMRFNHLVQNYPTSRAAKECSNCSRRVKCTSLLLRISQQECFTALLSRGFILPVWKSPRINTAWENWGMNLSPVPHWKTHSSWFLMPSISQSPFLFQLPLGRGTPEMRDTWYRDILPNTLCFTIKKHKVQMCTLRP